MGVLEDHFRAFRGQLVDYSGNGFLISGNRIGAEDNRVVRLDRHLPVHVRRHSGQSRHGLALASGCDQHHLLRRIILHLVNLNQRVVRHVQVAQL